MSISPVSVYDDLEEADNPYIVNGRWIGPNMNASDQSLLTEDDWAAWKTF